jgi:2,3-bisphosphoglycerate-dependent phosphoglycerate mutase
MRVYLVRHAHAVWSPDEARPLSPTGTADAERVADRLSQQRIGAIYSSPSRRALDTVAPLAARFGLVPQLVADLRERELPSVRVDDFDAVVRETWAHPDRAPHGGEANAAAQSRGLTVLRRVLAAGVAGDVVLGTHGTLLALILNSFDAAFDYEWWRRMSFPDIYCLAFDNGNLRTTSRIWEP